MKQRWLISASLTYRSHKVGEDGRAFFLTAQPQKSQTYLSMSRVAPLFPDNVHFPPTTSTISRQRPLLPYNVYYFPTCSTFSRQKGSIFANTFLTHLRSKPSKTFHFPFRDPSPSPTPRLRQEPPPRSASPAASPWILPACTPCHN
jgi:hypothetical protein